MLSSIDYRVWSVVTLLFCIGIAWSCMCRLNAGGKNIMLRVRAKHTLLMVGSLAFGGQPVLFAHWSGAASAIFSATVFLYLVAGMHRWRGSPPDDALKTPRDA